MDTADISDQNQDSHVSDDVDADVLLAENVHEATICHLGE
jgi:hypothetical protein